ncbi:DUF2937 family protein [Nitratireductor pacificus]|uniref:DUF2937 family protein n=1 Tax=Nitratireductor pacificus pht-3B TaxID=391937 RepID=K2MLA1_9HYPH|nr:DUF2937 family protein [Nitratireductor pacificus]EKF18012.1 hypothetical protein NA2_15062 [Nitratireductor pacificus pht-3B]
MIGLAVSVGCGIVTSQAPELAQQYRQRLNGALHELGGVVAAFDADAARNNLQRPEALALYQASDDAFLRDRGQSVQVAIDRLDTLARQSLALDALPAAARPLALVNAPDTTVLRGTLGDFEPAVPITPHGLLWAGVGFLFGFGLWSLLRRLFRRRKARPVPGARV